MKNLLILLLLTLIAASMALAGDEAMELPELTLEPLFVVTADGSKPLEDGGQVHPGETLALAVNWPKDLRPRKAVLSPSSLRAADAQPRVRRLVLEDPRAEGRDCLEVLVTTLGEVSLPPVTFTDASGTPVARSAPKTLAVVPRNGSEADEESTLRPPADIGPEVLSLTLIALALALLAALAWWLFRRFSHRVAGRKAPRTPEPPKAPASVRALDALEALLAEGLLERKLIKPFSVRLAEIGKGYLGEVAGVPLLERTSTECVELLRRADFAGQRVRWLSEWLFRLDMVKFAEDRPALHALSDSAEEFRQLVIEISEKTGGDASSSGGAGDARSSGGAGDAGDAGDADSSGGAGDAGDAGDADSSAGASNPGDARSSGGAGDSGDADSSGGAGDSGDAGHDARTS